MDISDDMTDILDSFVEESQIDMINFLPTDLKTLSLIDIFKRIIYPVDLFKDPENSSSIYSLARLCSVSIIRDGEFLARKYLSIKINLYDFLMASAIDNDCHQSIAVLMSNWPFEKFSIAKLIPDVLASWNNLVDDQSKLKCLSTATKKYTRCLIIFLNYVKNNSMSPLRVLDLRGMPMGDQVMNYMCREITLLANDVSSVDNYHILIDGVICTRDTYRSLICHLASQKPKLHLHFNQLDLSHLSEVKSWILLKQIDPKELVGLCIRASLSKGNFCQLIIMKFQNLTSLEIHHPDFRRVVRCKTLSFRFAPNLRRLSINAPTYYLCDVVPASEIERFQYLELYDWVQTLREERVRYLAPLPLRLSELNLRGHLITRRLLDQWINLFNSLTPTLKILDLEWCLNLERELSALLTSISSLVNLRYLNLAKNDIRMQTLCEIASQLSSMPELKCIRLPFINESLVEVISSPDDISSDLRLQMVEEIFASNKSTRINIVWEPYTNYYLF